MRNTITGSFAILALIVACVFSIRAYKSVVAENVDGDLININRQQYDEALAKWRSRKIAEYEMTVSSVDEVLTLRVNEGESRIYLLEDIVKEQSGDRHVTVPGLSAPVEYELYSYVTVGGMFEDANWRLDQVSRGTRAHPSDEKNAYSVEYDVQFDAEFGVPRHIYDYLRTTRRPAREITWRTTESTPSEVTSFKVMK